MTSGKIFAALLAAGLFVTPAMAKKNWTAPLPAQNGGMWTADLGSIQTVGKLDPNGPYIQVRVDLTYKKVPRGAVRRRMVLLYFRCDKHDGKIAAQTDWIENYGPVTRSISFDNPFLAISKGGDMRAVFDIVCRPDA